MTEQNTRGRKISIRAYATLIGVDEKTVRKARDAGSLLDGYDPDSGKIIPELADRAWGNVHKIIKIKPGVSRRKVIDKLTEKLGRPPLLPDEPTEKQWLEAEELRTGGLLEALKVTSGMTAQETLRLREIVGLALDKKKLEEAEGILIRRDLVEKALFLLGSELKKALLDIPARIVRDIMAATNEIEGITILTEEISQVLITYGNLKENSLSPDIKQ